MAVAVEQPLPSASVEVIATVGDDGSIRTRSVAMIEHSSTISSLADGCDDTSSDKVRSSIGKPVLIPIESQSDSEDSSSSGDEDRIGKITDIEPANTYTVTTAEDTAVGMYDCLSDQIANFFCPVEQPANFCMQSQPSTPSRHSTESQQLVATCVDTGCTEYQLQDFFNAKPGVDVFSSLQFWLTPSQEEDIKATLRDKPHNRSSTGRKRRTKHVQRLWDSWHSAPSIPLERSKSLPDHLRKTSIKWTDDEQSDDVCYDSDQEEEYRRKAQRAEALTTPRPKGFKGYRPTPINTVPETPSFYMGTTQVPKAPRNSSSKSVNNFNFLTRRKASLSTQSASTRRRSFIAPMAPTENDLMSPEGEQILRSFIQEATNTKIPMVWHRRTKGADTNKSKAPVAVTCAFEVGAHLDNLVVQPKFTWSPTFEPHLPQRKIRLSGTEPDSIELLSIIRVVKPTELNRNLYPFARLDRTCCITTNNEEFPYLVFEAQSTRERDWVVNALKIVVARLASIIIVRDEAMLLEFFTPYAALMHLDTPATNNHNPRPSEADDSLPSLEANGELQLVSYGPQ